MTSAGESFKLPVNHESRLHWQLQPYLFDIEFQLTRWRSTSAPKTIDTYEVMENVAKMIIWKTRKVEEWRGEF
jgi:hypothetical protein